VKLGHVVLGYASGKTDKQTYKQKYRQVNRSTLRTY